MTIKDLKYLLAYLIPISAGIGLYLGDFWSFGAFYIAFLIVPIIELFTPNNGINIDPEKEASRSLNKFFDWLLYLNLPIVYGLLIYYFIRLGSNNLTTLEIIGMTLNMGFVLGSMGINVAHELGHRRSKKDQLFAKILLLPNLYLHFFIEHNRGHHKNVGTLQDPATARKGEHFYSFWWRSVTQGYLHAWNLSNQSALRKVNSLVSLKNEMVTYTLIQIFYLIIIGLMFGPSVMIAAIVVAIIGFSFLEMVNYIEHYGLTRKQLENGKFEAVDIQHSWNSNHSLGRIFLYELTRHADHHAKATRKYQILKHIDKSPQLPTGYPGSIIVSLIPPLWFKMMNYRLHPPQ